MGLSTEELSAASERQRIRHEYAKRDRDPSLKGRFALTEPAFLFHMQEREAAIVQLLRREGFRIEGGRVLEVGCGDGHILQRFVDFGAEQAVGVDLMSARVRSTQTKFPSVQVLLADATSLPLTDDSFDLVMQFMCISSVLDPVVRRMIGREMWRVTRPGGAILSYDMRTRPLSTRVLREAVRATVGPVRALRRWTRTTLADDGSTPIVPLDRDEIERLFPGDARVTTASLDADLARLAAFGNLLPVVLGACSPLRTHHLALIRKPLLPTVGSRA